MRGEVGSRPYGRGGVEKMGKLHREVILDSLDAFLEALLFDPP